jgi:hypothetical protein
MNSFPIGARVEMRACTGFPGTVSGFSHGRVLVHFDDFANEPPKALRPESLQLAPKVLGVPKPLASGTRFHGDRGREESTACRTGNRQLFGTGVEESQ